MPLVKFIVEKVRNNNCKNNLKLIVSRIKSEMLLKCLSHTHCSQYLHISIEFTHNNRKTPAQYVIVRRSLTAALSSAAHNIINYSKR